MCYYKFGGFSSQHPALGTSADPPSDGEKGRGMPGGSNDSMSVGEAMEEKNNAKKNRKTVPRRMGKVKMASGDENMGSSSSEEGGGAGGKILILFLDFLLEFSPIFSGSVSKEKAEMKKIGERLGRKNPDGVAAIVITHRKKGFEMSGNVLQLFPKYCSFDKNNNRSRSIDKERKKNGFSWMERPTPDEPRPAGGRDAEKGQGGDAGRAPHENEEESSH